MIGKEVIRQVISDQRDEVMNAEIINRDFVFEDFGNYVFIGLRRVGKSYMLYQRIKQLMGQGKTWNDLLYINFEDERLAEMQTDDLNKILEVHYEQSPNHPIFFFDEIQNIPYWYKFVRRLADSKYRIYVTGSNSKMLSSEVSTTLGGRFLIHEVYPYSLKEYLQANKVVLSGNWIDNTILKSKVLNVFNIYFRTGGLPEIVLFKEKRSWLQSLYQKIFFGDLIARNGIRNDFSVKILIKKLAESIKQPVSFNRIANIVSSTGAKLSVKSAIEYVDSAESAWIILPIKNYAAKLVEKESNSKYYFIDNGILNLFLIDGNTSLLENLVAVELCRRYGRGNIYFFHKQIEIDFYVPIENMAIQVSYSMGGTATSERELAPFLKFVDMLDIRKFLIITYDEEKKIKLGGMMIDVLPIWKWLLF